MSEKIKLPKLQFNSQFVITESFKQRQWFKKHGKSKHLLFSEEMIQKLRKYFNSLDEDGSQSITAKELEDPLILFGLCKNKQQVNSISRQIDFDGSGEIEFKEFIEVFRRVSSSRNKTSQQSLMFKEFTKTLLGIENQIEPGVSFRMGMSIYRRKYLLKAILSNDQGEKLKGINIMEKFAQQVQAKSKSKNILGINRLPSRYDN